jgi:hypothetical protein
MAARLAAKTSGPGRDGNAPAPRLLREAIGKENQTLAVITQLTRRSLFREAASLYLEKT